MINIENLFYCKVFHAMLALVQKSCLFTRCQENEIYYQEILVWLHKVPLEKVSANGFLFSFAQIICSGI